MTHGPSYTQKSHRCILHIVITTFEVWYYVKTPLRIKRKEKPKYFSPGMLYSCSIRSKTKNKIIVTIIQNMSSFRLANQVRDSLLTSLTLIASPSASSVLWHSELCNRLEQTYYFVFRLPFYSYFRVRVVCSFSKWWRRGVDPLMM